MTRVGVLSLHNSKETKAILNAVEALGHTPVWLRRENTAVGVDDTGVAVDPDVDVVANRLLLSTDADPAESLGLARALARARPVLNEPNAVLTAVHKFATAATLAEAGVPVPDAVLAASNDRLNSGRDRFDDVGVYKSAIGTHGDDNWRVDLDAPVDPRVGTRQAILQELLGRDDAPTRDLRVYVVDGAPVAAMYRYAPDDDWRTNVALGGEGVDATDDISDATAARAVRAAAAVGLDYAGVDLIEDEQGCWRVLEVNPTAGFKGLYGATGVSPAPHIARAAIEAAGGTVDDALVDRLADRLDDEPPGCKPATPGPSDDEADRDVVGYVEEVVVSGTGGAERVHAKSDTGATRTSVDTQLAAEIGAGPIESMTRVKSGSNRSGTVRPVVELVVGIDGREHTVEASVEDRSHMEFPLLLGRDVLGSYRVDVRRRADGAPDSGAPQVRADGDGVSVEE